MTGPRSPELGRLLPKRKHPRAFPALPLTPFFNFSFSSNFLPSAKAKVRNSLSKSPEFCRVISSRSSLTITQGSKQIKERERLQRGAEVQLGVGPRSSRQGWCPEPLRGPDTPVVRATSPGAVFWEGQSLAYGSHWEGGSSPWKWRCSQALRSQFSLFACGSLFFFKKPFLFSIREEHQIIFNGN